MCRNKLPLRPIKHCHSAQAQESSTPTTSVHDLEQQTVCDNTSKHFTTKAQSEVDDTCKTHKNITPQVTAQHDVSDSTTLVEDDMNQSEAKDKSLIAQSASTTSLAIVKDCLKSDDIVKENPTLIGSEDLYIDLDIDTNKSCSTNVSSLIDRMLKHKKKPSSKPQDCDR